MRKTMQIPRRGRTAQRLAAITAIATTILGTVAPYAPAQTENQAQSQPQNQAQAPAVPSSPPAEGLPSEPTPRSTQPLFMRPNDRDFTKARGYFPNPLAPYAPTTFATPRVTNSPRIDSLMRDGKIYLSLSDAILLALENNFDIAIARYNLDIADTDLLRAHAGSTLLGVNSGLVTGTIGGNTAITASGGGPGGTSIGTAGAGAGASGLVLTTNGSGPLPEPLDPVLTGTIQLERATVPQTTTFITGTNTLSQNTDQYNFGLTKGFLTGTGLSVSFNNQRVTSNSQRSEYSPALQSVFRTQLTQHLLQGFGTGVNGRFIAQAINDRRITDSAFRAQLLYSINQVENIYWTLVSAYENVQSAQRALQQSTQVASDNRKQLEIGTLAPLDVLNADNQVATDKQTLITAQSNLEYQQLVMKQAITRNLNDPTLSNAPVIPTDRVSLVEQPEEKMTVEELVNEAYQNSPQIEQGILNLRNDQITLKGVKNGLLPTVDLYAFYGGTGIGGTQSPSLNCNPSFSSGGFVPCPPGLVPTIPYSSVLQNTFNNSGPDKGVGVNINIPIRNRTAQSLQSRSLIEYRQDQMKLEQIYVQTRINIINGQYALTNDRAAVQAAMATREYNTQALDAEQKKFKFGASTTANVLQQERNLAASENTVTSALATYARDRAALEQNLANTLERYGISVADAVSGKVNQQITIPGLVPASAEQAPTKPSPMPAQPTQPGQQPQPQATPPGQPGQQPQAPPPSQQVPPPPPPSTPPHA